MLKVYERRPGDSGDFKRNVVTDVDIHSSAISFESVMF